GDPIPGKSDRLFYVQVDPRPRGGYTPGEEPEEQMTRRDAETLLREKRGIRQAMMSAGGGTVEPELSTLKPFSVDTRWTSADFFPMFDVPMQYGRAWSSSDDDNRSRVVVLSKAINDKLFQGADSTGREIRLSGHSLRVIGVMKKWNPEPLFFDLTTGNYCKDEDLLVPFSTAMDLEFGSNGNMNCFGENPDGSSNSISAPCSWIQYWVELDPAKVEDYRNYLVNYSDQQRAAGRFERPTNVRLRPVMEWLTFKNAVPSDVRLQMWLALGFLGVCLVNTVGLLLAKFLDGSMLLLAIGLTLFASLAAGFLPAWRAMQVTPAIQLKSQ
ncbi:ABC transporter permease, partial [Klebsiella pneumoniae]